jgi:hypothetical protein
MGWRKMTGHTQLAVTPRDRFLQAVQKELETFEQREREFIRREREERATQLRLPINEIRIRSKPSLLGRVDGRQLWNIDPAGLTAP